ncbi:hypothetical protein AADW59_00395 [Candidatus Hodgkinia cicadicola]
MLIVSSIRSDDGKTTVVCGLAGVFYKLGLDFDLIKIGPDYLDSMCVSNFAYVNRINLITQCYEQFCRWLAWTRPCSLVEDCMGIMDGSEGDQLTTFALLSSKKNKLVLVLNCKNVMQSVAHLSSKLCSRLSGVILNNITSYRQESIITDAVNNVMCVPVLGSLWAGEVSFEKRHLGVVQPDELTDLQRRIDDLILRIYYNCNVDRLSQLMLSNGN